ncbi:MAG: hypothetical protein CL484_15300 [Acidobacteria bacterium]|nr:hypothetical protein [Acidobacteriota bacterium]
MTNSGGWITHPQRVWLRKAFFQIHLWTGVGIGLYVVMISLTGAVLIYRSELRQYFDPQPQVVRISGPRLSAAELVTATQRIFPDGSVAVWTDPEEPTHAVTMSVASAETGRQQFLFDPYSGEYLGHALPWGWRLTTWLLDLHDNLLTGETGRIVNGIGAVLLTMLAVTGAVIWWPGLGSWRRSVLVDWGENWRRLTWTLHSVLGIWTLLFTLIWGITGIYLAFPGLFTTVVDYLQPFDEESFDPRVGDNVLYWFTRLHFGRFGGWFTKVIWTLVGLVPPVMFVTGLLMWWNRVIRPKRA